MNFPNLEPIFEIILTPSECRVISATMFQCFHIGPVYIQRLHTLPVFALKTVTMLMLTMLSVMIVISALEISGFFVGVVSKSVLQSMYVYLIRQRLAFILVVYLRF